MKKNCSAALFTAVTLVFFLCMTAAFPGRLQAGANPVPIEGISYSVTIPLTDNLKALAGKMVYVHLDSGEVLAGTVKTVGPHLLHLERLDKRDFFDALIMMDRIIAIETQFRKY